MSIHVTCCLPKTSIPFEVIFPVCVHSRYLLSPKDQHSLRCCVPSLWPFTLHALSQRPAFPSVLCSNFMSIHVTSCLPKTSISFRVLFPVYVHSRYFLSPKTSIPFSVFFPVHVHSRHLLSPKDQHSLQCCVPSSCPFTLLAVSQRPAFPSGLCSQFMSIHVTCCFQRPAFPSVLCSQFMSVHVTCCLPKTCIPFTVVFPVHVRSRYLLPP